MCVSAHTGDGLSELSFAIANALSASSTGERQLVGTTAARCREGLTSALEALSRAESLAQDAVDQDLLAVEIRDTLDALGRLVGAVYTDDLLDRIFSRFCIGK